MESFRRALTLSRRADSAFLILAGALWVWKGAETLGRQTHVVSRNLGWGYFVDFTIPIGFTAALGLLFVLRRLALRSRLDGE